jgi:hypothetical protein
MAILSGLLLVAFFASVLAVTEVGAAAPPVALDEPSLSGWLGAKQATGLLCGASVRSFNNHINVGVRLRDGSRLRLKACRLGRVWYTRSEWIRAYIDIQTADSLGDASNPMPVIEPPDRQAKRFAEERDAVAARLGRRG